jgi:hypothetical protein
VLIEHSRLVFLFMPNCSSLPTSFCVQVVVEDW